MANFFTRFFKKSTVAKWFGFDAVFTQITNNNAIKMGWAGNSAVYSIVDTASQKFACIPRYVYDLKEYEEKSHKIKAANQTAGRLTELVNRPNEYQSQDAFYKAIYAYYKVCGEAFIWLNRGELSDNLDDRTVELKPVLEMYVLPSNLVEVIPDPEDLWGVVGYYLNIGGAQLRLRKVDVIHWKMPNLNFDAVTRTHLRGFSPLTAGAKSLQMNNDAADSAVRMYQHDGAKGLIYNETWDKLSPQQRSQIDTVIDRKVNNNDVKGMVATVQGKWGYLNFGGTSVDMQLLLAKDMSMKELCFLLGVPYTLFDPNTAFANSEWQQKNWINNRVIPDCKQLDGEFNRVLLKAFNLENKMIIACDYAEMPELQEDKQKMVDALMKAWPITPNEVREALGYESLVDPKMDEPWIPSSVMPLSESGMPPDDPLTDENISDYNAAGKAKLNGHFH